MGGLGGFKHTCKALVTEFANQLPELDPDNLPVLWSYGAGRAPLLISCMAPRRSTSPRI